VDVWRSSREHRTTGHAAEMAFFAVLTLVPSTVAVGAALGLSKHVIGASTVTQAEDAAIDAVRAMMGPDLADTVISPFVHAQLAQPRGGVALASLLVAWWLALPLQPEHAPLLTGLPCRVRWSARRCGWSRPWPSAPRPRWDCADRAAPRPTIPRSRSSASP
jgi:hypothetical protein